MSGLLSVMVFFFLWGVGSLGILLLAFACNGLINGGERAADIDDGAVLLYAVLALAFTVLMFLAGWVR